MEETFTNVPVLMLIFNRPDTTARAFEAIRAARPRRLYVAADGPRADRLNEKALCAQTREIIENIDWPCEVKRLYRDENLGCKHAISSAITWFFENEEEGIILEDDCLPDPSFFPYCQHMLDRYRNEPRVMMISGDDFILKDVTNEDSYYFATYFAIWGWATWRRAWEHYDLSMSSWPEHRETGLVRKRVRYRPMAHWLEGCFEQTYRGEIDTWDFQWVFTCLRMDALSICPNGNLISNIGYMGTHMQRAAAESKLLGRSTQRFDAGAIRHPLKIAADNATDRAVHRAVIEDMYPRGIVDHIDRFVWNTWKKVRGEAKG